MGLSFRSAEEAQFAERLAHKVETKTRGREEQDRNRDFSQVYPKGWTRIRARY
jgi:hypothetical protein